MANEHTEITELSKPKPNPSLLTYKEYYDTLMLAKKIRLENEKLLKEAATPKEKTALLEQLLNQYRIPAYTSSSAKDKEIITLLRINIFIPDNEQFIADYKTKFGKNVRLISDAYQIPAPFVIQKVTEIGKYEQYRNRMEKEGGLGEPELGDNSVLGTIAALTQSGALKPLYDSADLPDFPKTPGATDIESSKKGKKNKKKTKKEDSPKSVATTAEKKSSVSESNKTSTPTTDLSSIVSEEILQHLTSMQRYCTRLLDQNEQLNSQNASLLNFRKELETLLGKLKNENSVLKEQMSTLSKENVDLKEQVEKLTQENITLTAQISTAREKETSIRTIADETATEKELRKQLKDLQCQNQELSAQFKEEKEKKEQYKTRAIVAEVQLEQFEHGMQGLFQEVDALDFDLTFDGIKKS